MTDITKKVSGKVSSLAITRDGNKIKATFKVPSWLTDSNSADRATWVDHELRLDRSTDTSNIKPICKDVGAWNGPDIIVTGADRYWIRGQGTESSIEKNYDRSWYHPVKNGVYCKEAAWATFAGNSKAGSGWGAAKQNIGPVVWAKKAFQLPRKPKVSWYYDEYNSKATVTIKTDEGADWHERYDTRYMITLRKVDGKEIVLKKWTASRSTEITHTFDLSPYMGVNMSSGKYVTIKCQAYARGMAGDNPSKADAVTASRSVFWPTSATIGTIKCSSKTITGRITVPVTPGKAFASTTMLQLQRRHGPDGSWEDVSGATDNGDCRALYDTYSDASPVAGEYIYYRVKSIRDQFTQYGPVKKATCLYTAAPKITCSATLGVVKVQPSNTGTSATVVMGWTDSTKNTGWELSWSDRKSAWNSTEAPSVDTGTDRDGTSASSKYKTTKTRVISGLAPGTTYYIRVRRYRDTDDGTLYSKYSDVFTHTTESAKDDNCGIIAIEPSKSGTSAKVTVGYWEDVANTGTELSWSTVSGAWSSNNATPSTNNYETAGTDNIASTKWSKVVTLTIGSNEQPLTSGTKYYVRARRYKTVDGTTTYSPYSKQYSFSTESAVDDVCGIIKVTPAVSGKRATVMVGFNEDNENTGTEIAWSDDSGAWQSNVQPESMKATWARHTYSGNEWAYYQTSYLRELTPGKTYYIRARRYLEAGGNTTYTNWSTKYVFETPTVPGAANDKCAIVSVTKHSDNTGANVIVGWTEDTANDGTELTWSTDKDAWLSNQQPDSLQATWEDDKRQSTSWKKTQTISLHGLERGKTYYIKARRYQDGEDGTTYSPYSSMASITLPVAKTDEDVRCGLVSVTSGDDGKSATVVVGWDGDHTGCEVSWSTDQDAWESSEQPKTSKFDWSDKRNKSGFKSTDTTVDTSKTYYTRTGSAANGYKYTKVQSPSGNPSTIPYYELAWAHTSTLYLRSLEEGETYYVKARSYFDGDSGTSWSDYTGDMTVTPYSSPLAVVLSAPSAVARGDSIECYWVVGSELDQTEWHMHKENQPNTALATGTGSLCHASIPSSKYEGLDTISFYVDAGCGGGLTSSNVVSVGIADYPSCDVCCDATVTAQPMLFEVYTDNPSARLLCTLRANGVSVFAPDGDKDQLSGDVIWTQAVAPSWNENTTWSSTVLFSRLTAEKNAAKTVYDNALAAATFVSVSSASIVEGTTYYTKAGNVYTKTDPIAVVNPSSNGWYVLSDGSYSVTSDNSVVSGRSYYVRSGNGTDENPYVYTVVDPLSVVNPSSEGWYYIANEEKALTADNAFIAYSDATDKLGQYPSNASCIKAQIELPESISLWDGASYTLYAQTVEPIASLVSGTAETTFNVNWSHQASDPVAELVVDSAERSVTIDLSAPNGSRQDDVYDIYRTSLSGHELVAENIPVNGSVADPYAPFGTEGLHYRVCLRTTDGDIAFRDFPYELQVPGSRFDWNGKFVELPYNVTISEQYRKDFEARTHVDGGVEGYYGAAVGVTGSISSDIVKLDRSQLQLVREMGEYPGAVFCRTSSGLAFQCNADVSELGTTYNNPIVPVSIDLTKTDLTDQFKCNGGA